MEVALTPYLHSEAAVESDCRVASVHIQFDRSGPASGLAAHMGGCSLEKLPSESVSLLRKT